MLAEVGGPVDEVRLTLGIYGPELDPEEVSRVLGCSPTSAHRRGDPRRPPVPPWPQGAWLLVVEGKAPKGPDELVRELLSGLPIDAATWDELTGRYVVRIGFGIFVSDWNRGFELSPESMALLARTGASVGFDIYAEDADNESTSGAR